MQMIAAQTDESRSRTPSQAAGVPLLSKVTCPHCWFLFPPEKTLWISGDHPDLQDDPKIPEAPRRFPAERFDVSGDAIDARGQRCHALACPACHLEVPRAAFEYPPFFISIVGGPACGKSFMLPAMTWTLRSVLPRDFGIQFLEADPRFNAKLHEYEQSLFLNPSRDELVQFEKTQVRGQAELYDQVLIGGKAVSYPRPFMFRLQDAADHRGDASRSPGSGRTVCLYDNSGESYLPKSGQYGENFKATDHLGHSQATFFLFDPTQDVRIRDACAGRSNDPQMRSRNAKVDQGLGVLQHTILLNATARMKRLRGLAESDRHSGPLIIVLTKLDAWSSLLPDAENLLSLPISKSGPGRDGKPVNMLHTENVKKISTEIRALLATHTREIVDAAEGFSSDVTYLACSATGRNVQAADSEETVFGIRPRDVKPFWCELPFLVAMERNRLPLLLTATGTRRSVGGSQPHSTATRANRLRSGSEKGKER